MVRTPAMLTPLHPRQPVTDKNEMRPAYLDIPLWARSLYSIEGIALGPISRPPFSQGCTPAVTASSTGLVRTVSRTGVVLTPLPRSKVDSAGKEMVTLKPEAFDQHAFTTRPVTYS